VGRYLAPFYSESVAFDTPSISRHASLVPHVSARLTSRKSPLLSKTSTPRVPRLSSTNSPLTSKSLDFSSSYATAAKEVQPSETVYFSLSVFICMKKYYRKMEGRVA
jgi:hypothetical protein